MKAIVDRVESFLGKLILVLVVIVVAGAFSYASIDIFNIKMYGVHKTATVVRLSRLEESRTRKGWTNITYFYEIQTEDEISVLKRDRELEIGETISVIKLTNDPERVVVGEKDDSIFRLILNLDGLAASILRGAMFFLVMLLVILLLYCLEFWRLTISKDSSVSEDTGIPPAGKPKREA